MAIWTPNDDNPTPPKGIRLATRKNTDIENSQCRDPLTLLMRRQLDDMHRRYGSNAVRRTDGSAMYNCHGLVFTSRRAEINKPSMIHMILKEDDYEEIPAEDALPGDVMIYFADNGDAEHSAIVVEKPDSDDPMVFPMALVVSKWGKGPEYVHRANLCPYTSSNVKVYRVRS